MKLKINDNAYNLGSKRSAIRELFEYSKKRKAEIGSDKVFDFSIGNPSAPPPKQVKETIENLLLQGDQAQLHGYTSAQGDFETRRAVARNLTKSAGFEVFADNIYMTCGAASSLCITLKAIIENPRDEVIILTPFFPEYRVFISNMGGIPIVVKSKRDTFELDFQNIEDAINLNTKAIIINSPNNPSGVMYSERELEKLGKLLEEKSQQFDSPIYLISDEPYREIVFDGKTCPNNFGYYDNAIICYSYSKALSLAGERIGYIAISPKAFDSKMLYFAVCGAGRLLGYVCAPSLFQKVIEKVCDISVDISSYQKNRDILFENLTQMGFTVVKPQGAFYLFVKAKGCSKEFCEKAKEFELLLVNGEDFGEKEYVRLAFCKTTEEIENSLVAFEKFAIALNLK